MMFLPLRSSALALLRTSKAVSVPSRAMRRDKISSCCTTCAAIALLQNPARSGAIDAYSEAVRLSGRMALYPRLKTTKCDGRLHGCPPRSPNARDLHPTDQDLSVGTPVRGHPDSVEEPARGTGTCFAQPPA